MSHRYTFICDSCDVQFILEDDMEMPQYWFGVQFCVSDKDGVIPMRERDIYQHFCSQACIIEYVTGNALRRRKSMVDRKNDEPEESEDHDVDA